MTIRDFARKQCRIAREHGVAEAARRGGLEAAQKGLSRGMPLLEKTIWELDWDVCLVLDACRTDLMEEKAAGRDWLELGDPYWSVASCSPRWINRTFAPAERQHWRYAGYVTANAFTGKEPSRQRQLDPDVYPMTEKVDLAYLDEPWRDLWREDPVHTVPPAELTDRAMWAWAGRAELGMDRLVVHYMQPHMPFRSRPDMFDGWGGTDKFGEPKRQDDQDVFTKMDNGEYSRGEVWDAYADNLDWALDACERWARETGARVLLTADHGNGFGEWGTTGHPPDSITPAVRRVPAAYANGSGGEPDVDPPGEPPVAGRSESNVDSRLEALGYK